MSNDNHNDSSSQQLAPYKVICLTGGPCGGKTSSLTILSDLFQSLGWKVYRVPETATILLNAGVLFSDLNEPQQYSFQKDLLKTMLAMQDTYINLARLNAERGIKSVVICDRGAMDPSAYIDRPQWLKIINELHLDEVSIRDNRYDCVIHLVTAAKGAEEFYSLGSNVARSEGLELARSLDSAVMNAWNGHASLQVIDNHSVKGFAGKCDRVVQAVLTRLGLVEDLSRFGRTVRKHKFLIHNEFDGEPDLTNLSKLITGKLQFVDLNSNIWDNIEYRDFDVEHIYLLNSLQDGSKLRIRKREDQIGNIHFSLTIQHPHKSGQRVETRRNLSRREYETLRAQADPSRYVVRKKRRCFLFKDKYFQLDVYQAPHKGLALLETYLDYDSSFSPHLADKSQLPDWLELKEVTDNKEFSMFELSKIPSST